MRYYFAPMEGLTDTIFRRLHHRYFPGVDRYYTPFFSPTGHRALTAREARELPPADSIGYRAVPQLLTKVPEDFVWMARQFRELGYEEVNLNLGCPSGTVTAKGKGSGMLRDLPALSAFMDGIFGQDDLTISVKTRIGFASPEEFPAILDILNQYPIKELTVHPRVRTAFYKGAVDLEAFAYALRNSRAPVCYNGDLRSMADIAAVHEQYPQVESVMVGRGLIADPGMLTPGGTNIAALEEFHNALFEEYLVAFGGSRNAMFRLKEHWGLLLSRFPVPEKLSKRLRKTTDLGEFRAVTGEIFRYISAEIQ